MTLPKLLESKSKIRFQDCDPFNHLNNAKYIDYLINHREDELIRNYGIDIYKMAKTIGKSWVTSSNQIAYLKPALLMETVTIQSQLIYFDDSNLIAEMRMYNEDKSQIKAILWGSFVHFNFKTQKRESHSEDLMCVFKSIINPVNANTFDTRINSIKTL